VSLASQHHLYALTERKCEIIENGLYADMEQFELEDLSDCLQALDNTIYVFDDAEKMSTAFFGIATTVVLFMLLLSEVFRQREQHGKSRSDEERPLLQAENASPSRYWVFPPGQHPPL
jgi:hypothetical protein